MSSFENNQIDASDSGRANEMKESDKKNKEIEFLKNRIQELEKIIEKMKWKSYTDNWEEIYKFYIKHGIRLTSKEFDMPMCDVMNFIIECDNCDCLQDAIDYRECYIEVYNEDPYYDYYDDQITKIL